MQDPSLFAVALAVACSAPLPASAPTPPPVVLLAAGPGDDGMACGGQRAEVELAGARFRRRGEQAG